MQFIYTRPISVIIMWCIVLTALWVVLGNRCRRKLWHSINVALSAVVILSIFYVTVFSRTPGNYEVILIPFATFTAAQQQSEFYREMLMNMFLFFPLGLTLSNALPRKSHRWGRIALTTLVGCILSAGIEYVQYRYALGMAEIDDVICNMLGAFTGALSLCALDFVERHEATNKGDDMNSTGKVEDDMCNIGAESNRQYGIDFLKIISMLMIVLLHILNHGGVLKELNSFSAQYAAAHFLQCMAVCAVNVYVMISGYLYVEKDFKLQNIVRLWITVLFYSVTLPLLLKLSGQDIGIKTILSGFFPILRSQYWFFTQYFALFFMIPVLNWVIKNRQLAKRTLITLVLLLAVLPVFALGKDLFRVSDGYSFIWFIVLYLCGGYVKEYHVDTKISPKGAIIGYISCVFLIWLLEIGTYVIVSEVFGDTRYTEIFVHYTSPLVLGSAFFLIVLFSKIKFKSTMITSILPTISALTFGVYLIHDNPSIREKLMIGKFVECTGLSWIGLVIHVLSSVLVIFTACALIEYCRTVLFRYLKINGLAVKIERLVYKNKLKLLAILEREK